MRSSLLPGYNRELINTVEFAGLYNKDNFATIHKLPYLNSPHAWPQWHQRVNILEARALQNNFKVCTFRMPFVKGTIMNLIIRTKLMSGVLINNLSRKGGGGCV